MRIGKRYFVINCPILNKKNENINDLNDLDFHFCLIFFSINYIKFNDNSLLSL